MRSEADDQFQSSDSTSIKSSIEIANLFVFVVCSCALHRSLFLLSARKKLTLARFTDFILYFIFDKRNVSMRQSSPSREIMENTRCLSNYRRLDMKRNVC